jgi:hypothetical protein
MPCSGKARTELRKYNGTCLEPSRFLLFWFEQNFVQVGRDFVYAGHGPRGKGLAGC